jgi:hypothetical protein
LRGDVSLLLAEGHTEARHYPIGMVWAEQGFVRRRIHDRMATEAAVMQATIASVLVGGEHLKEVLEKLRHGE